MEQVFEKVFLIIGVIFGLLSFYHSKTEWFNISLLMMGLGVLIKVKNSEDAKRVFFNSFLKIFISYVVFLSLLILILNGSIEKATQKFSFIGFSWLVLMYSYFRSRFK